MLSTPPIQTIAKWHGYGQSGAMLASRISANLWRIREAKGLSRTQLAQRCSPVTSSQQIERLEKGERKLTVDWIERLSAALGVEPAELLDGPDGQLTMTPEVADEVALVLGRLALGGGEPSPAIAQVLSVFVQELSETFARHPEARADPQSARLVIDLLSHRSSR